MSQAAAVILAGGASSRIGGGDKPLLTLGGRTILARILERLAPYHDRIAISANGDPARFAAYGRPVLPDEASFGPLAGLLAGLLWARSTGAARLLTVPGDSPFIPPDLAARLTPPPAMAASLGRRHPTASLWPTEAAEALRTHIGTLDRGRRRDFSVIGFAARIGARVVEFDGRAADPFFNINTPDDLARAERLLGAGEAAGSSLRKEA